MEALDRLQLQLAGILVTHHHADHTGGVDALRPRLHGPVLGPARERVPAPFTPLNEGDTVEVLGLHFDIIDVPGHTAGHIAYAQRGAAQQPLLFCRDTVFSGIGQKRSINPFLRCTEPAVVRAAQAQGAADDSPVAVLAALREWKNRF